MIKNLYSIYDQKTQCFDAPFAAENEETAVRMFERIIKQVPVMDDHPDDFELYWVGSFSILNGEIHGTEIVQKVINGLSLMNPSQPTDSNNENTQVGDVSPVQSST